jgi:hypothetical protein
MGQAPRAAARAGAADVGTARSAQQPARLTASAVLTVRAPRLRVDSPRARG